MLVTQSTTILQSRGRFCASNMKTAPRSTETCMGYICTQQNDSMADFFNDVGSLCRCMVGSQGALITSSPMFVAATPVVVVRSLLVCSIRLLIPVFLLFSSALSQETQGKLEGEGQKRGKVKEGPIYAHFICCCLALGHGCFTQIGPLCGSKGPDICTLHLLLSCGTWLLHSDSVIAWIDCSERLNNEQVLFEFGYIGTLFTFGLHFGRGSLCIILALASTGCASICFIWTSFNLLDMVCSLLGLAGFFRAVVVLPYFHRSWFIRKTSG